MGTSNKQIAKNSLLLYSRMFFMMIVALFTVRIVLKNLGVEDYGIYNAVGGVVLSMTFLSRVLAVATQRFFSISIGQNDKGKLRLQFSCITFVYICLSVIIVFVAETVGLWFVINKMTIPENRFVASIFAYQFAILSFIITIVTNPHQALIIAHEKMDIYAYASIIEVVLKLAIVYLLVISPVDKLISYAFLMLLSTILSYGIYFIYCNVKYSNEIKKPSWNKQVAKDVVSYSGWTLFGALSGVCANQGLSIIVNLFVGPIANAAFAIANQISGQVNAFAANFLVAIRPPIIKSYAQKDYERMYELFYATSKFSFILMYMVLLPLFLNMEEILSIWLVEVGKYMVTFSQLMLIYALILLFSNPITTIVQAAGNVKYYHLLVDGLTLVCLPVTYLLYRLKFPAESAMAVLCIVFFVAHILRLYVLKKTVAFSYREYFNRIVLPVLITIVISYSISFLVKNLGNENLYWTLLNSCIAAGSAIFASFIILLNKRERTMLLKILHLKNEENN